MPNAPKRPCARAGCPALVASGYCDRHRPAGLSNGLSNGSKGHGFTARPSRFAGERLRGRAWMRIRADVLAEESGCYLCRRAGLADDEIDHVDGNVGNNNRENLRRAHKRCHAEKTGRAGRG